MIYACLGGPCGVRPCGGGTAAAPQPACTAGAGVTVVPQFPTNPAAAVAPGLPTWTVSIDESNNTAHASHCFHCLRAAHAPAQLPLCNCSAAHRRSSTTTYLAPTCACLLAPSHCHEFAWQLAVNCCRLAAHAGQFVPVSSGSVRESCRYCTRLTLLDGVSLQVRITPVASTGTVDPKKIW